MIDVDSRASRISSLASAKSMEVGRMFGWELMLLMITTGYFWVPFL